MENKTMTARYTNGKMTFMVGEKTIVTDNDIHCAYRSHIHHWVCNCPDNWMCLNGVDENGKHYTVWYKYEGGYNIDWDKPFDIVDEYSDCVWVNTD